VEVGLTLSGLPVPTKVPPQLPVYQSITSPAPTGADSDEESPTQIAAGLAVAFVGVAGFGFTVTVTLAQEALSHPVELLRARA
jgi:hypothetical protein